MERYFIWPNKPNAFVPSDMVWYLYLLSGFYNNVFVLVSSSLSTGFHNNVWLFWFVQIKTLLRWIFIENSKYVSHGIFLCFYIFFPLAIFLKYMCVRSTCRFNIPRFTSSRFDIFQRFFPQLVFLLNRTIDRETLE